MAARVFTTSEQLVIELVLCLVGQLHNAVERRPAIKCVAIGHWRTLGATGSVLKGTLKHRYDWVDVLLVPNALYTEARRQGKASGRWR